MTAEALAELDVALQAWARALIAQAGSGDTQRREDEVQAAPGPPYAPVGQTAAATSVVGAW